MIPVYYKGGYKMGTFFLPIHKAAFGSVAEQFLEKYPASSTVELTYDCCSLELKFTKEWDHFIFNISEHDEDEQQTCLPFVSLIRVGQYLLTLHSLVQLISKIKHKPKITIIHHGDFAHRIILAESKKKHQFSDYRQVGFFSTKPCRTPYDHLWLLKI